MELVQNIDGMFKGAASPATGDLDFCIWPAGVRDSRDFSTASVLPR